MADSLEQKLQRAVVQRWCWEGNADPLEEQHMVFTAELSLQPYITYTFNWYKLLSKNTTIKGRLRCL